MYCNFCFQLKHIFQSKDNILLIKHECVFFWQITKNIIADNENFYDRWIKKTFKEAAGFQLCWSVEQKNKKKSFGLKVYF